MDRKKIPTVEFQLRVTKALSLGLEVHQDREILEAQFATLMQAVQKRDRQRMAAIVFWQDACWQKSDGTCGWPQGEDPAEWQSLTEAANAFNRGERS